MLKPPAEWGLTTTEEQVLLDLANLGSLVLVAAKRRRHVKTVEAHTAHARMKMDAPNTMTAVIAYDRWRLGRPLENVNV